ncbi:site-specific integrase [Staphylococcus pseudintermedius]|nr:site-specific integrase [Staphylococcus pseudintermedius]MCE5605723.1 site-specific integrase [Staphylococcus pseudintermedius]MCE5607577.1 site-specific integrase [Staphylococcus pseudintermedius]MCE5612618.1 site-specific integrase [Staphylococcus pseudintermedius]MCE5706776.1 site-specific integrase [Staphylococcus pseudintermedius]
MYMKVKVSKSGVKRYQFYEKYIDPLTSKWREVSVTMNKDTKPYQNEARKLLQEKIEAKLKDRNSKDLKDLTLHEAMTEWINRVIKSDDLKQSTIKAYKYEIESMKKDIETDIKIVNVHYQYLQTLIDNWAKDVSYSRVKSHKDRLMSVFKYARDVYELNDITAIERVKLPSSKKTYEQTIEERENYLNLHEQRQLLKALQKMYDKNSKYAWAKTYYSAFKALEIQLLTGMRIGEVLALQFKDINFKKRFIDVNGTLVDTKDPITQRYGVKDVTKTGSSMRKIGITERAVKIFEELFKYKKFNELEPDYLERDYIFTNKKGNPLSTNKINYILKEALEITNIAKRVTTHTMRHTHVSILAQRGVPLKAIQERVGHSDSNMTLRIYTHVTDNMAQNLINQLEDFDEEYQNEVNQKEKLRLVQ